MTTMDVFVSRSLWTVVPVVWCLAVPSGAVPSEFRRWTSSTGSYSVEARLIEQDELIVLLERVDGARVPVKIEQLSREDREYLRQIRVTQPKPPVSLPVNEFEGKPLTPEQLTARVDPAVVYVHTDSGQGSGFFVGRNLVVTNFHVVEGINMAEVRVGGDNYAVKGFLACEPRNDLVLLLVERQEDGATLPLATDPPKRLADVFAFGSPRGFEGTVTDGKVSAVRSFKDMRDHDPDAQYLGFDDETILIQMTTAISPGNSGGPLVDRFGQVVGVNTMARTDAQSLNFAVAASHVQELLDKAKDAKVRSLLNLPRQPRPEMPEQARSSDDMGRATFEVKLPDGRIITPDLLSVPARELRSFLKSGIPRLEVDVHGVGKVESGFLCPAGPTSFGRPDGFAFIRREGIEKRLEGNIFNISEKEVSVKRLIGVVGFKGGRIDGYVRHIDVTGDLTEYYGEWTAGQPSSNGLFFIGVPSGVHALILRGSSGRISMLFVIRAGQLAETFKSLDQAMEQPDGRAFIEALEQYEAKLQDMSETIVELVQEDAKGIQQELIASRQQITRANIANRINQRRAEAEAAQQGRIRDSARRSGL